MHDFDKLLITILIYWTYISAPERAIITPLSISNDLSSLLLCTVHFNQIMWNITLPLFILTDPSHGMLDETPMGVLSNTPYRESRQTLPPGSLVKHPALMYSLVITTTRVTSSIGASLSIMYHCRSVILTYAEHDHMSIPWNFSHSILENWFHVWSSHF